MPEETQETVTPPAPPARTKDEIALELTKFIAVTTSYGKGNTAAGFSGKPAGGPRGARAGRGRPASPAEGWRLRRGQPGPAPPAGEPPRSARPPAAAAAI